MATSLEPQDDKGKILVEEAVASPSPVSSLNIKNPKKQFLVGFDCEFIDKPKELQTDCPICLHLLRDPYQATCCGYIYCKSCIDGVHSKSKVCPTCNSREFNIFPDKRLHKSLYGFKVWCDKKESGCNWSGELRDLDAHQNLEPSSEEERYLGCEYAEIECLFNCGKSFTRRMLNNHETEICELRPYVCQFCNDYSSTYITVVDHHQPECLFRTVPCPNLCGISPEKRFLEQHLEDECELRPPDKIPCDFSFAGCTEMVPPGEMKKHLEVNMCDHLSLMATNYMNMRERMLELQSHLDENNRYVEELRLEKRELENQFHGEMQGIHELHMEIRELRSRQEENSQLIEQLQANSSVIPLTFILDDYQNRRVSGDMGWSSSPFYTHDRGYRMVLCVDIGGNGVGKGIYMSVFLSILKGDYDTKMKWPFRGSVTVQLMNWRDSGMHHTEVIKYHDQTPISTAGRVMEGRRSKPWGKGKFIKHDDLKAGGFIKNNSLKFRVHKLSLEG